MSLIEKKSRPRYAPKLIKEIKERLGETQKTLALTLGITQQAVSEYERGKVDRERYDILIKLQGMLANAAEVKDVEGDLKDYVRQAIDNETRKSKPTSTRKRKKKTPGPFPSRRNAGT